MLAGYDSDSEDGGADKKAPGEDTKEEEEEEEPSETARLLAEVIDPVRATEGARQPADESIEPEADAAAAAAGAAADEAEDGAEEGESESSAEAAPPRAAAMEDSDEDTGEEEEEGASTGPRLPSAGQAFLMVDKKDIEKYRPKKKFEVKSFKKAPARRAAPTGPLSARGGVGTVTGIPMPAGLRPVVQERGPEAEEHLPVDEDKKRQALAALGLIEDPSGAAGEGPAAGKAAGKGASKGPGKDHLLPRTSHRSEGEEPEERLKRARIAAAEASGDGGPLRKGHILGLAADEVARGRTAASIGLE